MKDRTGPKNGWNASAPHQGRVYRDDGVGRFHKGSRRGSGNLGATEPSLRCASCAKEGKRWKYKENLKGLGGVEEKRGTAIDKTEREKSGRLWK